MAHLARIAGGLVVVAALTALLPAGRSSNSDKFLVVTATATSGVRRQYETAAKGQAVRLAVPKLNELGRLKVVPLYQAVVGTKPAEFIAESKVIRDQPSKLEGWRTVTVQAKINRALLARYVRKLDTKADRIGPPYVGLMLRERIVGIGRTRVSKVARDALTAGLKRQGVKVVTAKVLRAMAAKAKQEDPKSDPPLFMVTGTITTSGPLVRGRGGEPVFRTDVNLKVTRGTESLGQVVEPDGIARAQAKKSADAARKAAEKAGDVIARRAGDMVTASWAKTKVIIKR